MMRRQTRAFVIVALAGVYTGLAWLLLACGADDRGDAEGELGSGATAGAAVVVLTPRQLEATGVRTESATVDSVPETLATTGAIELDPARVAIIQAPVAGRALSVLHTLGDRVSADEALLTIESPEYLSGGLTVRAPRAGVITDISVAPQQLVTQGAELVRVASIDRVWLRVDLYGDQLRWARPGIDVQARVPALGDTLVRGRIASVAPSVEGATQAVAARVPLPNPAGRLRPGMFADARVATGRSIRGVLVPRGALIYSGGQRLVMIAQDSTYFPAVVSVGPAVDDRVVVLRGVNPGERVVVEGGYELFSAGYAFTRGAEEEEEEQ